MEKIGRILETYLKDLGIENPIKKYEALTLWSSVVGEKISSITKPERLSDGKMFVKVKNDTWRNELVYHKKSIIVKLNKQLGSEIVRDIVLI